MRFALTLTGRLVSRWISPPRAGDHIHVRADFNIPGGSDGGSDGGFDIVFNTANITSILIIACDGDDHVQLDHDNQNNIVPSLTSLAAGVPAVAFFAEELMDEV